MKKIKVAVIGAGHLGKIHARIYAQSPNAQLIGVCDTDLEKADFAAKTYNTKSFIDHRDLLDKVDAVSIATPTSSHYAIAREFLNHNIHTLVEKPITTTTKQAEELIKLAKKNKKILQVGHVERFNPAIKALQELCKDPQFIECHRLSPFPRRSTDVGVVLDLMIHDIDIVLSLVKSRLKNFQAIGVNVLSGHEDIANARFTFANQVVCNLTASRVSDDVLRKIRIFQKDSYISLDYAEQKIVFYKKTGEQITKTEITIDKKEPLMEELESFLQCVQTNKQPLVCGKDAKEALQIAIAVTKQIRQAKK